jgi:hypothetical protein
MVSILWYGTSTGGIPQGNTRYYWYAGDGTPVAYFDGGNRVIGGMTSGSMYQYYYPKVDARLLVSSPLEMDFSYYMTSDVTGVLFGTIRVDETMGAGTKYVYFAEVEDYVTATQRNLARYFVLIKAFTLTDINDVDWIVYNFYLGPAWDADNMKYIVFVQNYTTKEVLQTNQAVESLVPPIDMAVSAINSPTGTLSTGPYTVNATISNQGAWDQEDIPVNCTIYNDRMEVVASLREAPEHGHFENAPGHAGIYFESTDMDYVKDTSIASLAGETQTTLDFTPAWQADTPGKYRIVVSTGVPNDPYADNDVVVEMVEIQ